MNKDMNYEIGRRLAYKGNYRKAAVYLLDSAHQGNFDAANDMGVVFERKGEYEKALKLYELAASGGSIIAVHNLGNLYEHGFGVKQNLLIARNYYMEAARRGSSLAYKKLAKLYLYGLGVEKDYKKSNAYLKKGLKIERKNKFRDTDCLNSLAWNYYKGFGVKQSNTKALKLWKKTAKHGDLNGLYNVATCYLYGEGVKQNVNKAIDMLVDLACTHEYGYAIGTLADIYESDEYQMKDLSECGHWLLEGAKKSELHCLLKLAGICLSKRIDEYDLTKDFSKLAIRDFLREVNGHEQEYDSEMNEYKQLKEKYSDSLDWEYLETIPENIEEKEPNGLC